MRVRRMWAEVVVQFLIMDHRLHQEAPPPLLPQEPLHLQLLQEPLQPQLPQALTLGRLLAVATIQPRPARMVHNRCSQLLTMKKTMEVKLTGHCLVGL